VTALPQPTVESDGSYKEFRESRQKQHKRNVHAAFCSPGFILTLVITTSIAPRSAYGQCLAKV